MAIALIADSHLGGPGGDAEPMVAQLESLPEEGCRRLILMGDIFHVWVARRRFETAEVRRILPVLRRLREQGLEIDYVEGNRDFFLSGSPYAEAFTRVATEVEFQSGGRRCLAVHGDGLNDRDRQYLFWRWLSKSFLSRALVTRLPRKFAQRLVHSTEERLGKTNFKHRRRIPEEAILQFAERRMGKDYDSLFLGHFHAPKDWQQGDRRIHLLDAWFNSRRVEWLPD